MGSNRREADLENMESVIYCIRPYALNFIRAMRPFFDIVVFSKIPITHLTDIIDHLEMVLNIPTLEIIRSFVDNRLEYNKKFLRLKSMPLYTKAYFNCILFSDQYVYIE